MKSLRSATAVARRTIAHAHNAATSIVVQAHLSDAHWYRRLSDAEMRRGVLKIPEDPGQEVGWHQGKTPHKLSPVLCAPAGSVVSLGPIIDVLRRGAALTGTVVWPVEFHCDIFGVDHWRTLPMGEALGQTTVAIASSPSILGSRPSTQKAPVARVFTTLSPADLNSGENLVSRFLRTCVDRNARTESPSLLEDLQRLNEPQFHDLAPSVAGLVNKEHAQRSGYGTLYDCAQKNDWQGYLDAVADKDIESHRPYNVRAEQAPLVPAGQTPAWSRPKDNLTRDSHVVSLRFSTRDDVYTLTCGPLPRGWQPTITRLGKTVLTPTALPHSPGFYEWILARGDFDSWQWYSVLPSGLYEVRIEPTNTQVSHTSQASGRSPHPESASWEFNAKVDDEVSTPPGPAACIGFHTSMPGGVMISSPQAAGAVIPATREDFDETLEVKEGLCFVECFGGKHLVGDPIAVVSQLISDGAIQEVVGSRQHLAAIPITDFSVPSVSAFRNSRAWLKALKSAQYIVTNNDLPSWFEPRPEQIIIQTWHGKPVKKLGRDTPRHSTSEWYLRTIQGQAQRWNKLYTRDAEATSLMRHAYDASCPVSEGVAPSIASAVNTPSFDRSAARDRLGLPSDVRVISLLPTWMDLSPGFESNGSTVAFDHLLRWCIEHGTHLWPSEHLVLLTRSHHTVNADERLLSSQHQDSMAAATLVDVSAVADVRDIYAASDLVVSDYSSALTDAADMGVATAIHRPLPDYYEHYVRGIYKEAPAG